MPNRNSYWIVAVVFAIVILLGFGYYWQNRGVNGGSLPGYALKTNEVKAAYQYSLEDPEMLDYIPCYCNCYRLGHENVRECFVKEVKDDGKMVFDEHGSNCGICYYTVLESKALLEEGRSIQEIRSYIDNKYSGYGRGTDTPMP